MPASIVTTARGLRRRAERRRRFARSRCAATCAATWTQGNEGRRTRARARRAARDREHAGSANNCDPRRRAEAPNEARKRELAIARRRVGEQKFATFAHAISSTAMTAAKTVHSAGATLPKNARWSRHRRTSGPRRCAHIAPPSGSTRARDRLPQTERRAGCEQAERTQVARAALIRRHGVGQRLSR